MGMIFYDSPFDFIPTLGRDSAQGVTLLPEPSLP